ncbi:hypothetical protein INR49_000815 [Caranx melampygus]|nr:hypothetical protein INR49_000815 [Caranx melampygus]
MKALTTELKQRKKVIRTQQSLLTPRIISSQKCQHCEKSFLNSAFLQNHMQRRHPDEYDIQSRSDSEKKSQIDSLKLEISSLKEQIAQQQQTLQVKTAQEKEQQSMHKELLRELDRFKAEEMARMDRKIEDSRVGMRREMEFLYTRNIQALNEANQNQTSKQEKPPSPVQSQPERDLDIYKEMQIQAIQKLERQMKKQMRNISANPPTKVVEVPEEPVFALNLDPIQELSEEEKDVSSISERRPVEKKPEPVPEKKQRTTTNAVKTNPDIKREIRQELEQAVTQKLETLGIKPGQSGLKSKELTSILAKMQSKRGSTAKGMPDYWRHREEIIRTLEQKLGEQRRGSAPAAESQARSRHSVQVLQIRPRSSSLSSRATQMTSVKQPKTPQPAPRTKSTTQPKTSTPNTKAAVKIFTSKTPPFSSDEESESENDTDMEEEPPQKPQRGKSPQLRLSQATPVQIKASKASPVQARQAAPRQSFSSNPQQSWGSAGVVTKTAVSKMESDEDEDDWSEVSELQEIDPRQLQGYKDQNGNVDKKNFGKENKINVLARKMEQFADRAVKKPVGGVSILPERKDEVQELTYTDLEESSEWMVSSLEDRQEPSKPAPSSGLLRKSLDSPSTSVWGTSTGKGPKSGGLTEAGTGSTLKSSLCSLSDISDSEDISNK